ncbi:MAG: hypothetical protein R2942_18210 [Ignavibacteria bacterium]
MKFSIILPMRSMKNFTDNEKNLLLKLSFPESFFWKTHYRECHEDQNRVFVLTRKLYERNVFINREDEIYKFT